jgi:hypothetical protein
MPDVQKPMEIISLEDANRVKDELERIWKQP